MEVVVLSVVVVVIIMAILVFLKKKHLQQVKVHNNKSVEMVKEETKEEEIEGIEGDIAVDENVEREVNKEEGVVRKEKINEESVTEKKEKVQKALAKKKESTSVTVATIGKVQDIGEERGKELIAVRNTEEGREQIALYENENGTDKIYVGMREGVMVYANHSGSVNVEEIDETIEMEGNVYKRTEIALVLGNKEEEDGSINKRIEGLFALETMEMVTGEGVFAEERQEEVSIGARVGEIIEEVSEALEEMGGEIYEEREEIEGSVKGEIVRVVNSMSRSVLAIQPLAAEAAVKKGYSRESEKRETTENVLIGYSGAGEEEIEGMEEVTRAIADAEVEETGKEATTATAAETEEETKKEETVVTAAAAEPAATAAATAAETEAKKTETSALQQESVNEALGIESGAAGKKEVKEEKVDSVWETNGKEAIAEDIKGGEVKPFTSKEIDDIIESKYAGLNQAEKDNLKAAVNNLQEDIKNESGMKRAVLNQLLEGFKDGHMADARLNVIIKLRNDIANSKGIKKAIYKAVLNKIENGRYEVKDNRRFYRRIKEAVISVVKDAKKDWKEKKLKNTDNAKSVSAQESELVAKTKAELLRVSSRGRWFSKIGASKMLSHKERNAIMNAKTMTALKAAIANVNGKKGKVFARVLAAVVAKSEKGTAGKDDGEADKADNNNKNISAQESELLAQTKADLLKAGEGRYGKSLFSKIIGFLFGYNKSSLTKKEKAAIQNASSM